MLKIAPCDKLCQLPKDIVAIVTGASMGLGFGVSNEFAERAAAVIMCSRSTASTLKFAGDKGLGIPRETGCDKSLRHGGVCASHGKKARAHRHFGQKRRLSF
jgi:NAD(P)-dependent dehydrogenase (short-subunit alcohol dehydrogenase family)